MTMNRIRRTSLFVAALALGTAGQAREAIAAPPEVPLAFSKIY